MLSFRICLIFNRTLNVTVRNITRQSPAQSLLYTKHGEPLDVLHVAKEILPLPNDNEVSVKWLFAPVNPADINIIQGKYPNKPPLPAIPGNEGVGKIVQLGTKVKSLNIGDRVIPNGMNLGTWRTQANYNFKDLIKIPNDLGFIEACMLNVNPCTAYRMLKDFASLKSGDVVIQNGGNSAVGQIVIQLCKLWNFKNISIIRNRDNIEQLKVALSNMGASEVMTLEDLRTTQIFKNKKLPLPKLALNCICGKNALELIRNMDKNSTVVTYGAMSREPLISPASALIFKNITFKGFWMTAWTIQNMHSPKRTEMYEELGQLFRDKKLIIPSHKLIPFSQYQEAIVNTLNVDGMTGVKYILDMTDKSIS